MAAQPEATILAGVFNNAGSPGKIRLSALKQFGLLEGTPAAYRATQLARDIEAAADETEKRPLLRRAVLKPKVYRDLFNTYHDDLASKAKIRGRAQALGIHPDAADSCADLFMASLVTAALATIEGDGVHLVSATEAASLQEKPAGRESEGEGNADEEAPDGDAIAAAKLEEEVKKVPLPTVDHQPDVAKIPAPRPRMAADVTLNLTVDSSLDGDKLEKQLALLRRYGLI